MKRISIFLGNIFLPFIWMALTGQFTAGNFFIGVLLSSFALWVAAPQREILVLNSLVRLWRWLLFFLFFLWELTLASLRVVHDILTPRHRMRPAIIAVPLEIRKDIEITLLANLLTMTPGTLSLEVSPGSDVLYVHAMYVDDIEEFRRMVKEKYEKRVQRVLE